MSGLVRLEVVSHDGREGIVAIVASGEAFGLPDDRPSPWTAVAVGETEVLRIASRDIGSVVTERPADAASLIRGLLVHQAATHRWLADLTVLPLADRLASRLGELARRFGTPAVDGWRLPDWLTQERIGRAVGATRESVNRALQALARRGAVRVVGRRIVVPPPDDRCGGD